ncbi:MAG: hypothetical protein LE180_00330 [Endomicrobium sp.]|nr:hypothetical protein [Endomicrobium sp.]
MATPKVWMDGKMQVAQAEMRKRLMEVMMGVLEVSMDAMRTEMKEK